MANSVLLVNSSVSTLGAYLSGTILEEVTLAFSNFLAAVKAAGFTKQEIVFVDIAFIKQRDVDTVNTLYENLFASGKRPARTIYEVAALPFGGKIKVMGTAAKD